MGTFLMFIFVEKNIQTLTLLQWVKIKMGNVSGAHMIEEGIKFWWDLSLWSDRYQPARSEDEGLKALLHFENQYIQDAFNPVALLS